MKKIDTSFASSGQPWQAPLHLNHLQNANADIAASICIALIGPTYDSTKVYVLYGINTSTPVGGGLALSAGAVFCNGEIFLSPAQTLGPASGGAVAVANISTDYADGTGQTTFADSSVHKICMYRNIAYANGTSGTGTLNGGASANNNVTAFVRNGLVYNLETPTAISSYGSGWSAGANAPTATKNHLGRVYLQGIVSASSSTPGSAVCTLPAGFWPTGLSIVVQGVAKIGLGGAYSTVALVIDTSGGITFGNTGDIPSASAGSFLSLTGIAFDI
jgi:hypothetical protein